MARKERLAPTTGSGSGRNGIREVVEGVTWMVTGDFRRASNAAANKRASAPTSLATNAGAICGASAGSNAGSSCSIRRSTSRERSWVLRRQSRVDATRRHSAGFRGTEKPMQAGAARRQVRSGDKDKVARSKD